MSRGRRDGIECKVYVGDLARDVTEKDLERAFNYYGPLRNVWVARNPPGFAFIEFEDPRDADDAVRGLDDTYEWISYFLCFKQYLTAKCPIIEGIFKIKISSNFWILILNG